MTTRMRFTDVPAVLKALRPAEPVYCLLPERYREAARHFVGGFGGRVLYAVKANDDAAVLSALHEGGVRHFDCASLAEIESASTVCPGSTCYFMTPLRLRGDARAAHERHGVCHFLVDDASGFAQLSGEVDMPGTVVFVRMAVRHPGAMQNFANKFGAWPEETPALLKAVRDSGAEPALAFNVGSSVIDPLAYSDALSRAREVLESLPFRIRLLDIGGGFPLVYPGFEVPPLERFFEAIAEAARDVPLAADGELMAEPGRSLAAPGLVAVSEVLLRKDDRIYLNDGMYGIFWELRFHAHDRYPARAYREGVELSGPTAPFRLFGPTCDGSDALPGEVDLPVSVRPGDHLAFDRIGAYSLTGRTRFNGHYSDRVVFIERH